MVDDSTGGDYVRVVSDLFIIIIKFKIHQREKNGGEITYGIDYFGKSLIYISNNSAMIPDISPRTKNAELTQSRLPLK